MRPIFCVIVFLLSGIFICAAQSATLASLMQKLDSAKQDTSRVNIYLDISRWYQNKNPDSALLLAESTLQLARKINFKRGTVQALLTKGASLDIMGKYPEALSTDFEALRLSEALQYDSQSGDAYDLIGILYMNMGDYAKAIEYYKKSLAIVNRLHGDISYLMVNIGEVFKKSNQPDSSIVYNKRALVMAQQAGDSLSMAITLANIGDNYLALKLYNTSLSYLKQALHISESINDYEGIAYANNAIGMAYYQLGDYEVSISYADKSARQARELNIYQITRDAYHVLYLGYNALAQYQQALYYRNMEIAVNDSLGNIEKDKQIKELQANYDLQKKQQQLDVLHKERAAQQREIDRNKLINTLGAALFVLLALFTFHLYKNNRVKKKLNEQLAQQNKEISNKNLQLEELNNMKNKLFSVVGHDLRGPIGSLSGMLDLLNSDYLSKEESAYFLTEINGSLTATRHLLNNLLYWAKSQMEGMQVHATIFDVLTLIVQNMKLAESRVHEKGITLQSETNTVAANAYADEMMIDLVIRNLVENAIKFCRKGDKITIITAAENNLIKITVKDTGQGIPANNQAKLFNKLVTHTTFGTAREKGSGLGLLLCKELVEKNGGAINFTSTPGEGSSFYFTVPAAAADVSNEQDKTILQTQPEENSLRPV